MSGACRSLSVTFGLSTLSAAAFGQIFSDVSGVCFGGTVEAIARSDGGSGGIHGSCHSPLSLSCLPVCPQ